MQYNGSRDFGYHIDKHPYFYLFLKKKFYESESWKEEGDDGKRKGLNGIEKNRKPQNKQT